MMARLIIHNQYANYANLDKIIKLINQENQGVSKARNKGLDLAKGNILHLLMVMII